MAGQGDVVEQLVDGPLREGRVEGDDGPQPACGEAGREGHGVLLGDAHVVEPARAGRLEGVEADAGRHRGADRDEAVVEAAAADHGPREGFREGRGSAGRAIIGPVLVDAASGRDAVVAARVLLRQVVALALPRDARGRRRACRARGPRLSTLIMAGMLCPSIGPAYSKPRSEKRFSLNRRALTARLPRYHPLVQEAADQGNALDRAVDARAHALVAPRRREPGEVAREGAHVGRNGHLVVVEHDDEGQAELARVARAPRRPCRR